MNRSGGAGRLLRRGTTGSGAPVAPVGCGHGASSLGSWASIAASSSCSCGAGRTPSSSTSQRASSRHPDSTCSRAAAAVQGDDPLRAEPLTQWVSGDQAFELGEQVEVPATRQLGLDPVVDRVEPGVAETPCLTFEQQAPTGVDERLVVPHRQRFAQHRCGSGAITAVEGAPALGDEALETAGVDDVGIDAQAVTGCGALQKTRRAGPVEALAEPGDPHPQHTARPLDVEVRPELVNQGVGVDDTAGPQREDRQQRAFLGRSGVASTPSIVTSSGPRTLIRRATARG